MHIDFYNFKFSHFNLFRQEKLRAQCDDIKILLQKQKSF